MSNKLRLAYFTPLNPQYCGIAEHSEELLPYLAEFADVTIVTETPSPTNQSLRESFPIIRAQTYLAAPDAFDVSLYQLGNHLRFHGYMVPCLRAAPGVILLQDYCLNYLVLGLTLGEGELGALEEALQPTYGARAKSLARRLMLGLIDPTTLTFAYPFLKGCLGVAVHSDYTLNLVREQAPETPVRTVTLGIAPLDRSTPVAELRQRHSYGRDDFIVASVSTRAPKKRIDVMIEAVAEARERIPNIKLLVVGGGSPGTSTHRLIQELSLEDVVIQTGWVDADTYADLIRLADVAVDIREMGGAETASSVLRVLAAGTPAIVAASGTFLDLPDDCCPKVALGDGQAEALCHLLEKLHAQPDELDAMRTAALAFAEERLSPRVEAEEIVNFAQELTHKSKVRGPVDLLQPRAKLSRPIVAALYKLCNTAYLLRSYGISDSFRRLRLKLAGRFASDSREVL
ncbi:MAG: glycosyltransferase [Pseudomonadota bacterium]